MNVSLSYLFLKMSEQGMDKLIKASKKEGGKLGMDLTGAAELGGTEFFVRFNKSCILMFFSAPLS